MSVRSSKRLDARRATAVESRRPEDPMATIDADGHVIEPADLWERELPAAMRERGFHVRWNPDTRQEEVHVEGRCLLPVGIVGVGLAGRPFDDVGRGVRYAEL